MIRLILIVVLLVLALVGGTAVALHHFFGWKGLIAFPFLLIAMLWIGKIVVGKIFKNFLLSLFSMKSVVLKGATITVHSITAIPAPPPKAEEPEDTADDEAESAGEDGAEEGEVDATDEESIEEETLKHYFQVDATITPAGEDRVWEPGEFILTADRIKSLSDLEEGDKELGNIHEVQVWNGTEFGPDEEGKYPGAQRLLMTFAVKPATASAWLHYYNEPIGKLELPAAIST